MGLFGVLGSSLPPAEVDSSGGIVLNWAGAIWSSVDFVIAAASHRFLLSFVALVLYDAVRGFYIKRKFHSFYKYRSNHGQCLEPMVSFESSEAVT